LWSPAFSTATRSMRAGRFAPASPGLRRPKTHAGSRPFRGTAAGVGRPTG
jgi:hypothetical protein